MMGEETRLLLDIVLLTAIAGLCSIILVKLRLPAIIGYLVAGIVLGPTMLPELWVQQSTIDLLAGLGIVLLMFYIGLELNLRELKRIGTQTLIVVTVEMSLMVMIGYLVGTMLGLAPTASIFLGAIISGTSTAVIVAVLHGTKHIDAETSKRVIGITVLEDVGQVVILTLAAPMLVGDSPTLGSTLDMILLIGLFILLTIILGATIIPKALDWVGKRYSGEILLIVAVAFCFTMALISSLIGLSLAIGAFLMGVIVSLAMHSRLIKVKVEPMKELFMAVFFISIGTQIYPELVLDGLPLAIIIAAAFIIGKILSVGLACYLTDLDGRSSFTIALNLVAMGEFAFIIAKVALDAGLVNLNFYSSVIGAALITMLVLPLISKSSAKIVDWSVSILPRSLLRGFGRINELKAEVRKRLDASSEVRNRIKTELFLILIDLVLIVSVQIVFDLMITADNPFRRFAQGLGIAPLPFLFLLGLILITPAVFNTMIGIRRIATIVASSSGGSVRRKESEVFIYKLIKNIGNALMGAMLVLLFIPFISIMGDGFPTALLFLLASWLVLLYFSWKSYKSAYDRVCSRLSRSVMEDINRED